MKNRFWMPTSKFDGAQVSALRIHGGAVQGGRGVFVSDIHRSKDLTHAHLDILSRQIRALQPDILLLGGDYGESADYIRDTLDMLGAIPAPLGRFAVPGNNDTYFYEGDQERLRADARQRGIRLLIDEAVRLDGLCIGGLQELRWQQPDYKDLFAPEGEELRLLLGHYPQAVRCAIDRMTVKPHLAMAGHTHGGQFALGPITPYTVGFEHQYGPMDAVCGVGERNGVPVLVSGGIGTSRIPLRIGVRPCIHLIEW